ncbi:methyltransferase domain-containing protein [Vibrio cholerae]|nr:methyltransferase domain-containing protein [Vibrio cholerae]
MATERLYFSSNDNLNIEKNADDLANIERHESRYLFAAQQLARDSLVLDCACGSGYGSDILKDYCARVIGVDIDPKAVDFANRTYSAPNLSYLCGDIRKLSKTLDPVDIVVCLETLEHVSDPRILMDGFMNVLKPDGKLIISTPVRESSRENPLNSYHVLEFTIDDLKRILEHYFYNVEIRLQDQDRFIRIDEPINWGFIVAICQYPKNKTIHSIDMVIKDREVRHTMQIKQSSSISETASIAESVLFKPTFGDGRYQISDNVEIRDNCVIENHNNGMLIIGSGSVIGYNCWINATGDVSIGEGTLIGANTIITSSSHHTRSPVSITDQGLSYDKVSIGSNVWIGSNVSILKGVNIGDNAIIGANCVVKNDVQSNTVLKAGDAIITEIKKRNHAVFYLLPFNIRGSALTFECIFDRYKKLAASFKQQDWDISFVATNELSTVIKDAGWNAVSPSDFSLSYDNAPWFERWQRVLKSERDECHEQFLVRMLDSTNPEIVFCWNFDGLLKQMCGLKGVAVYFNELGVSRAPNPMLYYSDPLGVNSTSSFLDYWKEFELFTLSEYERTIARLTLGKVQDNYRKLSDSRKAYIKQQLNVGHFRVLVLIVLQVEDDSNIVSGSDYSTMQDFINHCLSLEDSEDIGFVIKKHPSQPECKVDTGGRGVLVDQEFATEELVELVNSVFTINSSVGFEARIAGKEVFVFGRAPYAVPELFHQVTNGNITKTYHDANTNNATYDTFIKFVYLTYHQYFISEQKFFDAETHIRRHRLRQCTNEGSNAYFFDSGSFFKERELEVNRFQNKVMQDSILGYENWIKSLKETEGRVQEVSEWAQSLDAELKRLYQTNNMLKTFTSVRRILVWIKSKLFK